MVLNLPSAEGILETRNAMVHILNGSLGILQGLVVGFFLKTLLLVWLSLTEDEGKWT
jgi:hypothetical protein